MSARTGFIDSYHTSRLTHLTGTSYPSNPAGNYLGIYAGNLPNSAGTGGNEISPATRPAITFGSIQTDGNGRQYITNTAAITGIVLTNTSPADIVGFGLFAANSGGTPIYYDHYPQPFHVNAGQTISIPAGAIKIYAEPPTIS